MTSYELGVTLCLSAVRSASKLAGFLRPRPELPLGHIVLRNYLFLAVVSSSTR